MQDVLIDGKAVRIHFVQILVFIRTGIGLLLAGIIVESFGTYVTFSCFAVGCVLYAIFFFVIQRVSNMVLQIIYIIGRPGGEPVRSLCNRRTGSIPGGVDILIAAGILCI